MHQGMGVSVDEPRHEAPSRQVQDLGIAYHPGLVKAPDERDPPAVQADGLRGFQPVVDHRMDRATSKDHACRLHPESTSPCLLPGTLRLVRRVVPLDGRRRDVGTGMCSPEGPGSRRWISDPASVAPVSR